MKKDTIYRYDGKEIKPPTNPKHKGYIISFWSVDELGNYSFSCRSCRSYNTLGFLQEPTKPFTIFCSACGKNNRLSREGRTS